jgi:hypothetical protein
VSAPHSDQIIDGYLARLRGALTGLPAPRQQELLDDVRRHIAEARGALQNETDADILNILDRIGEPADIAAAARGNLDGPARPPSRIGAIEIGAVVLTPFLWPVGVILLWISSAWNTRDKLIGTLVPPGGYLGVGLLPVLALVPFQISGGTVCRQPAEATSGAPVCQNFGSPPLPGWVGALGVLLLVVLLVLPLLTAVYLGYRLRRSAEATRPMSA